MKQQEEAQIADVKEVEEFWDDHLCGSHFIDTEYLSEAFFRQYRAFRYQKEHHLLTDISWKSAANKSILEIGLGVGADATKWAEHAGLYTGVDLTNEAVLATRKHFQFLGLEGNIHQGNAEHLSFEDNTFDMVYSHGVLHHTPNMQQAINEVYRVVKPGGEFIVMLYAKESFNYWIRIQFYFRIRMILEILRFKIGGRNKGIWERHMVNFREQGWKYLNWNTFPHHCTDGPECNVAFILSKRQTKQLLHKAGFTVQRCRKAHFPITKGKFPKLERGLAGVFGFYRFCWCKKPA